MAAPARFPRVRKAWLRILCTLRKVIRSAATPNSIALGVAIGFVVGWTPTVGFQMMIAAPLCVLFRANFLAAVPPIWLTNPATILPIYGFNYWVGMKLVGGPGLHEFLARLKGLQGILLDETASWAQLLSGLWALTLDFLWPLWIGCFAVGFALAVPAFFLARAWVVRVRIHMVARREARIRKLQEPRNGLS